MTPPEQLAVVPRQHYVIMYMRVKFAPHYNEVTGTEDGIRIATRPDQLLPKLMAHGSVIADLVVQKFVYNLPL